LEKKRKIEFEDEETVVKKQKTNEEEECEFKKQF
jgi:hypothetical protein